MPYGFLLVAVVSLGTIGVLHKVADHKHCRPEAINLFIFLGAAIAMNVVSIARSGIGALLHISMVAWATAVVCGFIASTATLAFQHGVKYGKISTNWLIINLSMVLPTVLSILVYREIITLRRTVGLLLAVATLFLLWRERVREESRRVIAPAVTQPEGG